MPALTVAKRFNQFSTDTTTEVGYPKYTQFLQRGQGGQNDAYQIGANQRKRYAVFEYDYARDGALAVGHNAFGWYLPQNAIITESFLDILTQIAGPTAVKVGVLTSGDLLSTGGEGAAGRLDGQIEPGTEAGWLITTSTNYEVMLEATIAGSTAGKIVVFIGYIPSTTA